MKYLSPLEMLYKWEQEKANEIYLSQPIDGIWHNWTWKEYGIEVRKMASYLKSLDLPDNSVCIADSQSLHCVTDIRGSGQRFTTVAYTDRSCATLGHMGKSERLIRRFAKKESGSVEDFL